MAGKSSFLLFALLFLAKSAVSADLGVEVTFSSNEVSIIRAYYEQQDQKQKPPKKGRQQLPPGIAKNLGRGKPLPPGIAKQVLPNDLVGRLPPVRDGYERIIVDGKVILVEIATQIVHDVLTDILLK
jgi:hypothetical protein